MFLGRGGGAVDAKDFGTQTGRGRASALREDSTRQKVAASMLSLKLTHLSNPQMAVCRETGIGVANAGDCGLQAMATDDVPPGMAIYALKAKARRCCIARHNDVK